MKIYIPINSNLFCLKFIYLAKFGGVLSNTKVKKIISK
jgi:hypothetical protein